MDAETQAMFDCIHQPVLIYGSKAEDAFHSTGLIPCRRCGEDIKWCANEKKYTSTSKTQFIFKGK